MTNSDATTWLLIRRVGQTFGGEASAVSYGEAPHR
jgi:hypothetical protein